MEQSFRLNRSAEKRRRTANRQRNYRIKCAAKKKQLENQIEKCIADGFPISELKVMRLKLRELETILRGSVTHLSSSGSTSSEESDSSSEHTSESSSQESSSRRNENAGDNNSPPASSPVRFHKVDVTSN